GGGLAQQMVVDAQGQALAGLAVGAIGERPAAEGDDVLAGGVAVEDLEQEAVDGGDRIQQAAPPGVLLLAAGVREGLPGEMGGLVLSQAFQDGQDAWWHERAPSGGRLGSFPTARVPEVPPMLKMLQAVQYCHLTAIFAAFYPFSFLLPWPPPLELDSHFFG